MLLGFFLACSSAPAPAPATPSVEAVPAEPAPDARFANVAPAVVREVLAGDGRTYARLQEAGYDFWVSVPAMELAVGDRLRLGRGPLQAVHSAALERDFAAITVIEVVERAPPGETEEVAPAPGGVTVAELYTRKAELAGKPVLVRGRVVKANLAIFGKNWYHLRDGTGAEGSDDLAVTSELAFALGDVVTARAPLTVDKDLGFGYFFPVILEDAAVVASGADPAAVPPASAGASPGGVAVDAAAPASATASASTTQAAPASSAPSPASGASTLANAPTRRAYGLEVGGTTADSLTTWLAERHLGCTTAPAIRRTTVRTECHEGLAAAFGEERPNRGVFSELLLSRADAGPVHYLALAAKFSIPDAAAADFGARLTTLRERLGPPTQERPLDASRLDGKLVRFSASWSFADLDVDLALFKGMGGTITVTEAWAVPGVEEGQGARAGSRGHGGGASKPAGWNPHVLQTEAIQTPPSPVPVPDPEPR